MSRFIRHVLFIGGRYFVIFDELEASRPATFTWLYHILPEFPFSFDPETFTVDYAVGDVKVRLVHVAHRGESHLQGYRRSDAADIGHRELHGIPVHYR